MGQWREHTIKLQKKHSRELAIMARDAAVDTTEAMIEILEEAKARIRRIQPIGDRCSHLSEAMVVIVLLQKEIRG